MRLNAKGGGQTLQGEHRTCGSRLPHKRPDYGDVAQLGARPADVPEMMLVRL